MPAVEQWESYFDAAGIVESLGCRHLTGEVVEFGCGYGTFTIPAAQRTTGTVHALDIDPLMVAATVARTSQAGLRNVMVEQRDFVARRLRARTSVLELRHAIQYSAHRRSCRAAEGELPGPASRRVGRSDSLEPRHSHTARAAARYPSAARAMPHLGRGGGTAMGPQSNPARLPMALGDGVCAAVSSRVPEP